MDNQMNLPDPTQPVAQVDQGPVQDPVAIKPSWFWIKDTNGNASVSTTLVTVAFMLTSAAYFLSIVDKLGPVSFRPFDAAAAGAYFVPILTLYFGRHWVDSNAKNPISGG